MASALTDRLHALRSETMGRKFRQGNYESLMIRLAAEGVPIGALSRAFQKPRPEIARLLVAALNDKTLAKIPAQDWPDGITTGQRATPAVIVDLDEVARLTVQIKARIGMTRYLARALALLLMHGHCTTATLHAAVTRPHCTSDLVKVTICNLRHALDRNERTRGIVIETVFGQGYTLTEPGRTRLRQLIAEEGTDGARAA